MEKDWVRRPSSLPLFIAIMAMVVIVVGGTIRIYDAGESCPDWPQCFGTWGFVVSEEDQGEWYNSTGEFDSRGADHRYSTFEIFIEWVHRLIASLLAIPVLANFIIIYKKREIYGDGLVKISFATGILLMIQGAAGAVTVHFDNADWTVALHLTLASIFVSVLLLQFVFMRQKEGAKWASFSNQLDFRQSELKRVSILTLSVLILLVLGAWVSSTAGGNYNQACSIGFPDGWPQCQGEFFPSLDGAGILVQMIHRLGAGLVGIALIVGNMKLKEKTNQYNASKAYSSFMHMSMGFWFLNVFVGGFYIILADSNDFPEGLSLLHLIFGVASFLTAAFSWILLKSSIGVMEDE